MRAEPLLLPSEYGTPEVLIAWESVRSRLESAAHYWLATVRPDGRPHALPVDGLWLGDEWYFGGSAKTVKLRNLKANPSAAMHLEDAGSVVAVEGRCDLLFPPRDLATRLAELSHAKYGYGPDPASYATSGVWRLQPERVLAWERFPRDATRFVF